MSRFYFNLGNGAEFAGDRRGVCRFLISISPGDRQPVDVMAGNLLMGDMNSALFIEIEDEQHQPVETVFFEDVVKLKDERGERQPRVAIGSDRPN